MTLRTACIASCVAIVSTTPVAAEDIYRCGPRGAIYSQTPCSDGQRIDRADARNDEQRLQARQVNERIVALAESLERERLASEAAHRPALAGSFSAPSKTVAAKTPRSSALAKAKKRLRASSEAAKRRAPKSAQEVVLAQPRS